jgi:hypothetical protein
MPTTIDPFLCMVWFCVGFFTGAGWTLGSLIVSKIMGQLFNPSRRVT